MLRREHFSCASHAGLDFIEHQQNAMLIRQRPKLIEKLLRWNNVTAFALDWLDEDGSHFVWRQRRPEDFRFDVLDALHRAGTGCFAVLAAIAIGVGDVMGSLE